ncbi:hypothetical protein AALP_AA2G173600 [Arabis alpina]|uniref:Protein DETOXIFICATION n=1 Tax=Arabis alpina TaxID=50452 RepID=A0A087HI47_ARAAL|nr:hypothetical protein AALP_AA2G173600 [Arabis alpina]
MEDGVTPPLLITERDNTTMNRVKEEVKKQLWLSAPLIGVSLLQYSLQVISVMFVGHLGSLPLSAASIATSFASVTGFTFLLGTASALETLCGQAYGAKLYGKLGIQMQRAIQVYSKCCWLVREIHATESFRTGLGYRGAALAISVSYWVNVVLLSCYVKFSPSCSHSWTGFSKEAFCELYEFSKIAFPSAVMVCLELWSFELLVLASGLLPNPVLETSVLSICLNTSLTIWQISVGLGGAASIRVSNELGAGNPQVAKLAVYVIVGIAVAQGIVVVTVLISIRKLLGHAFSSDPKIISYAASMIPIVACGNFLDGLQCVLSGVARGCGWQKIGACVNLGSYYLVGVPLGLLLGFHFHVGGRGLWLGIVTALAVQVVCLSLVTIFTNWDKEAKKATNRVGSSGDKDEVE